MESPRLSPSGPFQGLARLSISTPLALADGVAAAVPFDRADILAGSVGEVLDPMLAATYCFAFGPGAYLLQAQYTFDEAPTSIAGDLIVAFTGGTEDTRTVEADDRLNMTMNVIVLPNLANVSGDFYSVVGARLTSTGAAISVLRASLLISRVATP